MNVVRTAVWMILTALVVGFVVLNWGAPQQVKIWPGSAENDFLFEWPVGFMALVFFLAGFVACTGGLQRWRTPPGSTPPLPPWHPRSRPRPPLRRRR